MAEMEGVKQVMREEEEEEEEEHEEEEEEQEGDIVSGPCYQVNSAVTLQQSDLCEIYTCLHWRGKSEHTCWSYLEIKQMIGHASLKLDKDEYQHLDLNGVIMCLLDEEDDLTKAVKVVAEHSKDKFVEWISSLYKRGVEPYAEETKSVSSLRLVTNSSTDWASSLAKQQDDELAARQDAMGTPAAKRRRIGEFNSIAAVLEGKSSGSQGGQGQGGSK
ncbi:hypothetical protein HO173_009479 [Letharia columbiana]|uniref:Uncharacterized protein n=1 Tax=Letharia columbiana TaxID=112416 RepID=A0A8H6FPM0_9LECA|nr:uncharacterized protein HO173_009479 [Letharia columbiana]KAF6232374.1 hypothetical protein HO173_009479 [Letharia columbiana]